MINILTNIDKTWTSFWSPISVIWELRIKFSRHFGCLCVPLLLGVFRNRQNITYWHISTAVDYNWHLLQTDMSASQQQKVFAASLFRRKQGLGLPIHTHMPFIFINMPCILIYICYCTPWYHQCQLYGLRVGSSLLPAPLRVASPGSPPCRAPGCCGTFRAAAVGLREDINWKEKWRIQDRALTSYTKPPLKRTKQSANRLKKTPKD